LRAPHVSTLAVPGATLRVAGHPHAGREAVVYFGGNAEDVSMSLPQLHAAFPDHALYLLHYCGYGGGTGKPTEAALVADALALFDHMAVRHPDIIVIGRSLGSGVAIQVAGQRDVAKLVLITPYDSLQELAVRQFPYFPVRWLLRDKYESWRHAPNVTAPTRLIAARNDDVVPLASSERLLARFKRGVATLDVVPGAGHNTISADPAYIGLLQR
jgi:pimeloyl-ACP methyl ester carboxylesterase